MESANLATAAPDLSGRAAERNSLSASDRWQPATLMASVAAGLTLGATAPSVGQRLGPVVTIGVFALITLVMLGLDLDAVRNGLGRRRFLATATALNFVVNPLLAWGLAHLYLSGHPNLRIGLIVFLVTPCIGWYLVFTELARGDVALGASLLGINIVLQILLLPVYLLAFVGQSEGFELSAIAESVVAFLVAPATIAWVVRRAGRRIEVVRRARASCDQSWVKTAALVAVIVAMFASETDTILNNPDVVLRLLPAYISFFAVAFLVAVATGKASGFTDSEVVALVFTATSRNSEASLALAATAFASPLVALTVIAGPIIELPLLILMTRILARPAMRAP